MISIIIKFKIMNTTELLNNLCNGNIERLGNCLKSYREYGDNESIFEVGYNSNSGYVYIALENGISICEAFNGVEYLVTNMENGDEYFFDTYKEAEKKLLELNDLQND